MSKTPALRIRLSIITSLLWLAASAAHAQSLSVWSTTTGNWSDAASWSPAIVPLSDSTTVLNFGGSADYTATNDVGAFTLNQLNFTNTAGTVTLAGSPVTNALNFVTSSDATQPSVLLSGAGSAAIAAPVIWTANTSIANTGAGALAFNGGQTFATGTKTSFTNSGTGSLTFADAVTYATSGANNGLVLNLINANPAAGSFSIGNLSGLANTTINIGGSGTVRFSGTTSGDLFSSTTVLNVQDGATFDFNGHASETLGAISGAGTLLTTTTLGVSGPGNYVFSGKLSGTGGGLTLAGAVVSGAPSNFVQSTLTLTGSTSDYTGVTAVTSGRLIVSANAPSGSAGALGNATSEVLVGNTSAALSSALIIDTAGVSIGRNIRVQTGNSGVSTVGGFNTSGTTTFSGNITLGTNSAAAKGVTLYAAVGGITEFTGNLVRATSASGTTDTVIVTGGGTVAMRGANTYTGTTTVNAGTLLLDYTTNNGSKLRSTAALILNGGSLNLTGNNAAATTQAVSALTVGVNSATLGGGSGRISATSGTDRNLTLTLAAITRNTGATVDFLTTNTGTGIAAVTTTTALSSAGILGGYATYNLNDWATKDGSNNIIPLAAGSYASSFATGTHTSIAASTALPSGGATTNTLRLTAAAALTFNATPGTLTLESGGLMIASTAGATSIGTTGTRGTLASTTNEIIIQQQSASLLTINSVISGTTLTKSGTGPLTLTGTNTYTGNTYINGGIVTVTAATNLGATPANNVTTNVVINGGTLAVPSGSIGTIAAATSTSPGRAIIVGPAGATFNFTPNIGFSGNGFSGSGPVTKTGVGIWSVGANGSTFSGTIAINAGALSMTSAQLQSSGTISIASGASFIMNDDGTGNWFVPGGQFIINGTGLGGNGAIRVTDQTTNTAVTLDPVASLQRDIVLQSSSRIQTDNGSAAGSLSTLVLPGAISGPGTLTKAGNGLLIISGRDNSWTGGTIIENGALRLGQGNDRLPVDSSVTLGGGTTSGNLQLSGFTQTLAGLGTSGTGTANAVTNGNASTTGLLTLNIGGGSQNYDGTLGGTGVNNNHASNNLGFVKDGAGMESLSAANTYTGPTLVKGGTLQLGNAGALGNGGAGITTGTGGTTVAAGATLDLNGLTGIHEVITLNGSGVGGAGALVNNGNFPATLGSGVSSLSVTASATGWTGGATVTLDAPSGGGTPATATALLGLGTSSFTITNGGSGFGVTPVVTVTGGTGAVVAPQVGLTNASFTVAPGTTVYSSPPTVTLTNGATGVAILSDGSTGTAGTVIGITITNPGSGFSGTPTATFSGGTVTTSGTAPTATGSATNFTIVGLTITNPGTGFTAAPVITITGGTGAVITTNNTGFALNGIAITANGSGYTSQPGVTINGGTASATANLSAIVLASDSSIGGNGDLAINPVISGGFALTKVGAGTTTLAGANTYTGATTVSGGILQVGRAGSGTTGTGAVTILAGTHLTGTGTVRGPSFTLASGATLQAGDITSGTTTGNGTLTFTPASGGPGTYNLQSGSSVRLSITTATLTDATFGGNAVGTAGYNSFVDGVTGTGNHDLLVFNGGAGSTLTFGSNLTVQGSGFTASAGQVFNLIDWANLVIADFSGFNPGPNYRDGSGDNGSQLDLPDISSFGLAWDISRLTTSGNIAIVSLSLAPEPGRLLLLVVGCLGMMMRRRR